MILVIDNFDSFTYNIVQYLSRLKVDVLVKRNNEVDVLDIEKLKPSHIVISPGPNTPKEAGISLKTVNHFAGKIPILGVCLGHQAIGDAFGATIVRAAKPVHGKTSLITHSSVGVFTDLPSPLKVTRYHSLIIDKLTLPPEFDITAWTTTINGDIDEIMAIKHRKLPIEGVQFHPESILSQEGLALFNNFLCQN